jgi:hypothetical protein
MSERMSIDEKTELLVQASGIRKRLKATAKAIGKTSAWTASTLLGITVPPYGFTRILDREIGGNFFANTFSGILLGTAASLVINYASFVNTMPESHILTQRNVLDGQVSITYDYEKKRPTSFEALSFFLTLYPTLSPFIDSDSDLRKTTEVDIKYFGDGEVTCKGSYNGHIPATELSDHIRGNLKIRKDSTSVNTTLKANQYEGICLEKLERALYE